MDNLLRDLSAAIAPPSNECQDCNVHYLAFPARDKVLPQGELTIGEISMIRQAFGICPIMRRLAGE